jgi:hypothetical protein
VLCGLRAHDYTWMGLGSFIPLLYSGTLISLLFGLKILLTLTLGSRNHFVPESPFAPDDRLLHQKILKIPFDVFLRPLCRSYILSQLLLLLQDAPKYSPMFRESFVPTALQFLVAWIHLWTITHPHWGIRSSPVVRVIPKIIWNTIWSPESPLQPIALKSLVCLHYG